MAVRKSASQMSDEEWETTIRALINLKAKIANPNAPAQEQISVYDQFTAIHTAVLGVRTPSGATTNQGHRDAGFGPWHREFLRRFEATMQVSEPDAFLPYWDWTDTPGTFNRIFTDATLGRRSGPIVQGYFAYEAPGDGANTTARPSWWPNSLIGWRVPPQLLYGHPPMLAREEDQRPLATDPHVNACLAANAYEGGATEIWTEPDTGAQVRIAGGFRQQIEGGPGGVPRTHNFGHGWTGGHMGDALTSPSDPIFYFHHCYIDKLWSEWQADGHQGPDHYPAEGQDDGHNLEDNMWPWVGGAPGYVSLSKPLGIELPDFSGDPPRKPVDVLSIADLGYSYA